MTIFADKERLLRSTILAGVAALTMGAQPVFAQDVAQTPDAEEEEDEDSEVEDRIVVTGSRIARSEFTTISPVQVLSGEVSRDLGLIDADDVLNQLTVVQGQQTDLAVSTVIQPEQAFTTFGSVTPSLRGLGSAITGRSRNLVMINGRRYGPIGVGGAPANPDISLIPGSMISRVEVLLDGASSVYGSDAIAGVINYILRDDVDGFELNVSHSTPEIGHGRQSVISGAFGLDADRGFVNVGFEYNIQDSVTRFDRRSINGADELGIYCNPELEIDTNTGEIFRGCSNFLAGFAIFGPTGGTFPTLDGSTNIGVPGWARYNLAPYDSAGTFGATNDPYARSHPQDQFATLVPDQSRFSLYATGEYDLDGYSNPNLYFEFNYSERNLETVGYNQGVLEVTADTPGNPGLGDTLLVHFIRQEIDQNLTVARGVIGVRGDLPFMDDLGPLSNWTYDTSFLMHRSRGTQRNFGDLRANNTARVLNGSYDSNGLFVCALDETIAQPTRPNGGFTTSPTICPEVNFFDPNFMLTGRFLDQASNDFILGTAMQNTLVDQLTYSAIATGDLFDIPTGGTAAAVFGFEHRTDVIETANASLTAEPNAFNSLNTDVGSTGQRRLWEGFFEASFPLLEGQPFAENLQIDIAARYTDEEFFGNAWTYQVKGEWAPVDWLSFAAGFGTSYRAPDTGEQFGTGIAFASLSRADPCLPSTNTLVTDPNTGLIIYDQTQDERQASVIALCDAIGVSLPTGPNDVDGAAALGLFGIGTVGASFQNFSVLTSNGGSTDVGPETSEALFAKITFQQPWFDSFNFNASVNYFEYLVEDSIGQLTTGLILGTCFNDANAQAVGVGQVTGDLCQFQQRDPVTGLLTGVNEASFNLGAITSRGIDLNMTFSMDLTDIPEIGEFFAPGGDPINVYMVYRGTTSFENSEDISGDGTFDVNLGEFGFPEHQINFTTQLGWRDFRILHRFRYSEATFNGNNPFGGGNVCVPTLLARDPAADTSGCTEYIDLPAVELHDLTGTWSTGSWVLRMGVQNVFDEVVVRDTAIAGDGSTGTPFGLGYSMNGRAFFANVIKQF